MTTNGKFYHFSYIEEKPKNKHQGGKQYYGDLASPTSALC